MERCVNFVFVITFLLQGLTTCLAPFAEGVSRKSRVPRVVWWAALARGEGVAHRISAGGMLSAFSAASGNALSWLPPFWALFWVMFFACLRAGLEAKALSVSQVLLSVHVKPNTLTGRNASGELSRN